jgi:alpha-galactosidase
MNNGPYYHLYDVVTKMWDSPTGNPNIFFNPGPARGWIARSTLDYDTWIPSVLFLTHYLPNIPANSRQLNIASLMLGHNGIWGDLQDVSNDDTKYIASLLDSYKLIREDITKATIIRSGIPGGSPEVYEKINPETGKGIVVMFTNTPGTYEYFTNHKVDKNLRTTDQTKVKIGKDGRAIITCSFTEPSAQIIFFGNQK